MLYEVGGAYDTAGQEKTALEFYVRALDAGLKGDLLRRGYLQYGSTLRNVVEHEKSREIFAKDRMAFPESPALRVFETITLHGAGQTHAAIASLLELITKLVHFPDLERYKPAITGNAAYIRSQASSSVGGRSGFFQPPPGGHRFDFSDSTSPVR